MNERVNYLRKSFEGKDCLIITAGPSLKNICKHKLREIATEKVVIAVKQAYYFLPDIVDIHVINDNNYEVYNYDDAKNDIKVILVKSSSLLSFTPKCNPYLQYKIVKKSCNWNSCLAKTCDFENHESLYDYGRNWGPGIMYELCIYFPLLFNSRSVIYVAWDLGSTKSNIINRFYEKKSLIFKLRIFIFNHSPNIYNKFFIKLENVVRIFLYFCRVRVLLGIPGITKNEARMISDSSSYLSRYYASKNISKYIISDSSMLHESFVRI